MKPQLTNEEKKYLRRLSRYMYSFGYRKAEISIFLETYDYLNLDDIFPLPDKFDSNYRMTTVDTPEEFEQIIAKIFSNISEEDFSRSDIDGDYINSSSVYITLDCEEQELVVEKYIDYTGLGREETLHENIKEEIDEFKRTVENPEVWKGTMTLPFNGSGDSGYIEEQFSDSTLPVPAAIIDLAYRVLESNFGGWEIDEGSNGSIEINFDNGEVIVNYEEFTTLNETNLLYRESFEAEPEKK